MIHRQKIFLIDLLKALFNGARVGEKHFSVSITSLEVKDIISELEAKPDNLKLHQDNGKLGNTLTAIYFQLKDEENTPKNLTQRERNILKILTGK